MIWGVIAAVLCIFWPLWDARKTIATIFRCATLCEHCLSMCKCFVSVILSYLTQSV